MSIYYKDKKSDVSRFNWLNNSRVTYTFHQNQEICY